MILEEEILENDIDQIMSLTVCMYEHIIIDPVIMYNFIAPIKIWGKRMILEF